MSINSTLLPLLLATLLSFTVADDDNEPEAGWNTPNIVHQKGKWRRIPSDFYDASKSPQPPVPYDDKYLRNETSIIVLIAAYRETRCPMTLFNLYSKAAHPNRIFIGIVQQNNKDEDEDCIYGYCKLINPNAEISDESQWNNDNCPYLDNIKANRLAHTEAKGPVYARALQSELVEEEDFCMQIDAHSDAYPAWDVLMLREWGKAQNEYGIISTYPSNIKDIGRNSNNHWEMPHLCEANIAGAGRVHNGRARAAANLDRPILAPLWAAGLSFSRCHVEKRVPNDVNLKHVFTGEEYSRGARLWTHGYDFYSPSRAYIGTFYQSQKGNKGSWQVNHDELRQSNARMATLLRAPGSDQSEEALAQLGRYAVGTQRSLDQYFEFSGVNTNTGKVDMTEKCIAKWVAWSDEEVKDKIVSLNAHGVVAPQGLQQPADMRVGLQQIQDKFVAIESEFEKSLIDKYQSGMLYSILLKAAVFVAIVMVVVAVRFRFKLRKACNDIRFKHRKEDYIL